jgi:hypothetical protein
MNGIRIATKRVPVMNRLLERNPASTEKRQRPGKSIRQEAALKKGKTGRGTLR